jgi:hypothetical protein
MARSFDMAAPHVAPSQLALRFTLEIGSLVAWGLCARNWATGMPGIVLAWSVPGVLAIFWGTFAVPGDPSRSGTAPVPVPGGVRLGLELLVFVGAAVALAAQGHWIAFGALAFGIILHHAMTIDRIRWLVGQ